MNHSLYLRWEKILGLRIKQEETKCTGKSSIFISINLEYADACIKADDDTTISLDILKRLPVNKL